MDEQDKTSKNPSISWRFKLGLGLFALSFTFPIVGVPIVSLFDLTTTMATSISALVLGIAEVCGLAAVAVMGKDGFVYIKGLFSKYLKQYGPPQDVSYVRYMTGLLMFCLPILFGWGAPYAFNVFPEYAPSSLSWVIWGDFLFLASLCVLGGNFWDKLRSLFVHGADVVFK